MSHRKGLAALAAAVLVVAAGCGPASPGGRNVDGPEPTPPASTPATTPTPSPTPSPTPPPPPAVQGGGSGGGKVTTKPAVPVPPKTTTKPAGNPTKQGVHPGAFCAPGGAYGLTVDGTLMQCKKSATDARNRWRAA